MPGWPVRAGIVGPAGIGRVHARALAALGVPIAGVAASSLASGRRHAQELQAEAAFPTAAALIEAATVDVVHICTPNSAHAELVRSSLAAGKHVICEKPLATSLAEARELKRLADSTHLVAAVCYHLRFVPALETVRRLISTDELGEVQLIQGSYLLDEILRLGDRDHWMLDPALMGPSLTLADIGVHFWDLVEHLTERKVVRVVALTKSVRSPLAEDTAAVLLELDGDAVGIAALSQCASGHDNTVTLEVCGTAASVGWSLDLPDRLDVRRRDGDISAPVIAGAARSPASDSPESGANRRAVDLAFERLIAAVYSNVPGSPWPSLDYPDFRAGVRGGAILDALLRSVADSAWRVVEA